MNALVLQPDNKLVAVGGSGSDIALARYLTGLPAAPGQLLNISTRLRVLRDAPALIGGFIITGTEAKKVIVRALGPSLADGGVSGAYRLRRQSGAATTVSRPSSHAQCDIARDVEIFGWFVVHFPL